MLTPTSAADGIAELRRALIAEEGNAQKIQTKKSVTPCYPNPDPELAGFMAQGGKADHEELMLRTAATEVPHAEAVPVTGCESASGSDTGTGACWSKTSL